MKIVYVKSFDIEGYGELVSDKCGNHVRMLYDDSTLYFQDDEIFPLPEYDAVVRTTDPTFKLFDRYGGAELSSILFLFDVDTNSDKYKFMKSRLRKPPFSITIMPTGGK